MANYKLITALIIFTFCSITAQHKTSVYLEDIGNEPLQEIVEKTTTDLLTLFNVAYAERKKVEINLKSVSDHAKSSMNALWETAPFQCSETELITRLIKKTDGGYELRNIPFTIRLTNDSLHFEEGVFQYSDDGVIQEIYFGIETHQYNKLLRTGKDITDFRRRQMILSFVENFRTAYNRKDIDLLEKVFSEQALIIVGRVIEIKKEKNDLLEKNLEKKRVELIRMSKAEYIKNLRAVFKRNLFIDVGFDEIDVVQHRIYNDIYGVQLKQYWKSSTYRDVGYLFLMIDFEDEAKPLIHVRAWQPEKETDPDSAISLGDFEIIK
ncbi:MAG: hypothetical protein KKG93_19150 [Bacteroidetes bacterium]|nr:hypothetical protein [Bacteroidota bacterium]